MNPTELKVAQLKNILKSRQLAITGRKAELILRMQEHDPMGSWIDEAAAFRTDIEEEEPEDLEQGVSGNLGRREFELSLCERKLMEREIDLLRRENAMLRSSPPSAVSAGSSNSTISLKGVGELLSEYNDSGIDFVRWKTQLTLLKNTYGLDDNATKILIGSKLKGKAFHWYHSRIEHFEMSTEELLTAMASMFDQRPGRLELRRQFEACEWRKSETFADYCHRKLILGNRVPIPEEELVDYIIEGIPSISLQEQTQMQCFSSVQELLNGFKKIRLDAPKRDAWITRAPKAKLRADSSQVAEPLTYQKNFGENKTPSRGTIKCYECNKIGHYARNCQFKKQPIGDSNVQAKKEADSRQIGCMHAVDEKEIEPTLVSGSRERHRGRRFRDMLHRHAYRTAR